MSATDVAENAPAFTEAATARAVQDALALRVQKAQGALHAKLAKKDAEIAELKKQLASAKKSNTRVHKIPKPSAPRSSRKQAEGSTEEAA